jgi:hypothetical protein
MTEMKQEIDREKTVCPECDRLFDLLEETDANDWFYGHDCDEPIDETGVIYDPTKRSY